MKSSNPELSFKSHLLKAYLQKLARFVPHGDVNATSFVCDFTRTDFMVLFGYIWTSWRRTSSMYIYHIKQELQIWTYLCPYLLANNTSISYQYLHKLICMLRQTFASKVQNKSKTPWNTQKLWKISREHCAGSSGKSPVLLRYEILRSSLLLPENFLLYQWYLSNLLKQIYWATWENDWMNMAWMKTS